MPVFSKYNSINRNVKQNKNNNMEEKSVKELIELAECYLFGRGNYEKDEEKAIYYLKKGAFEIQDEDSLQAQVRIILLFYLII